MKGPKAILASSIATALDEFFEVDKDGIQSTLLGDAQISLQQMKLRPRMTELPNSWANIEGSVRKATFSWVWGPAGNWVKDATLTIEGLKIIATITEENPNDDKEEEAPNKKRQSLVENMEEAAQPHTTNPEEISNQGGISGYIQTQVQKIIDSMKLRVEKYELSIVLPKQQQVSTSTDDDDSIEVQEDGAVRIDTRGEILELVSLGRLIPTNPDVSSTSLEQELILQDFIMQIKEIGASNNNEEVILDLVERFTYKASTHRSGGQRFDQIMENLQVQGHGGDLKVHLGTKQIKTLSYLGVLLMAPPSEIEEAKDEVVEEKTDTTEQDTIIPPGNTPSHFDFDLGLLQLTMDTNRMELPNAKFVYRADGTIMKLESDGFAMQGGSEGSDPYTVKVSKGMQANLKTPMTLTIGSIDEIFVPYTAKLTNPIANTKIIKEGLSYSVDFVDDVQIEMLKGKEQEEDTTPPPTEASVSNDETKMAQPQYKANVVPFPLSVSMKHLVLTKEEDDNRTDFQNLYAFANPTDQGTEFAVDLAKVQNYLLCAEDALVAGILDQDNQINKFRFSSQQVQVTAGHTPGEWAAAFEPTGTAEEKQACLEQQAEARQKKKSQQEQRQSQQEESSPPMKFPNCYIDPLRLTISWKAPGMTIAVKDTKVTVKEFHGKDDTTVNDLVQYYVQSCLAHASDFIPNAQLLGLNVVDSTMGTVGNYIGMATLGPLGGIAAIGAVDAVKQTISAGKKSRNRDDGAQTHPLDVFRGLAYTIQETGHDLGSNPIHFAQDTIGNTGAYIDENKARLGGAGVGGAGMILGGIFGGPAGAIVAGVLSQAVAEKVITTTFDDTSAKKEPLKLEA